MTRRVLPWMAALMIAYAEPGWKLVWADEFDKDGRPDPAKWTYEKGYVRNHELQYYQPQNARCEGGFLIIEGRKKGGKYTSASLTTWGISSWKYGRFEMRGRIDVRAGLWPAFWTLGAERPWPWSGEVDIMEYYRGMLLANLIWAGKGGTASFTERRVHFGGMPVGPSRSPGWASQFHVWRMDWDEKRIVISVDGEVLNDADLDKAGNPDGTNGFRQPHYIILNLAIGGTAGGDPSNTKFPAQFEVDWVRIYQRE